MCFLTSYISFYFIIIITIFLFFVFLAVERNFWILEVDSFFFIEMKCFLIRKKIFLVLINFFLS